ncbi:unnamed protein product [Acanthoscelides obtectus]|uniref:Nuclease HARBI1 n=1 Tax=Acanthoscelides obtectus TaxID=200917 RepID=A0A9P0PX50_ACAOB|nr:unnamed protein product [Acanthoscelides obtectus]CAK1669161.1 Putative nuclease HARBI1 [Acanthoscelides obtectus]
MSSSSSSENEQLLWRDSSDSESSSDTSEDELAGRLQNRIFRTARNFRARVDHFTRWNEDEFRLRFRLSKNTVIMLEERIRDNIAPNTERNHALTSMQQLLLVLRLCATASMLQTIGDFGGIHKSTASQVVKKVIHSIVTLAPEYIKMPRTQQEMQSIENKFYNIARFPWVIVNYFTRRK